MRAEAGRLHSETGKGCSITRTPWRAQISSCVVRRPRPSRRSSRPPAGRSRGPEHLPAQSKDRRRCRRRSRPTFTLRFGQLQARAHAEVVPGRLQGDEREERRRTRPSVRSGVPLQHRVGVRPLPPPPRRQARRIPPRRAGAATTDRTEAAAACRAASPPGQVAVPQRRQESRRDPRRLAACKSSPCPREPETYSRTTASP